MTYELNTQKIKHLLDNSTTQLPPDTLQNLRAARNRALDHQRTQTSSVFGWIYSFSGSNQSFHMAKPVNITLAILLTVSLIMGVTYWHHSNKTNEISEIDIAILTDDMPISVFLD